MRARSYYRAEARTYPRQNRHVLPLPYAAAFADELLRLLGEPPVQYRLVRDEGPGGTYHACNRRDRIIEFRGSGASVLDVMHEVAHLATLAHDEHHAATVALIDALMEEHRAAA